MKEKELIVSIVTRFNNLNHLSGTESNNSFVDKQEKEPKVRWTTRILLLPGAQLNNTTKTKHYDPFSYLCHLCGCKHRENRMNRHPAYNPSPSLFPL